MDISIVIPLLNEEASLPELHSRLSDMLEGLGDREVEFIFVDDGSTDRSFDTLLTLRAQDSRVRIIRFLRNRGKAAALAAAFSLVKGQVVVTLDADLQDDPDDIPRLLAKLDEGFDLVSGWKQDRKDARSKVFGSYVFNRLNAWTAGLHLHDINCGLKAYRQRVVKTIPLYGELHRFIPIMAHQSGFRVAELPTRHHARRHGSSRYGPGRIIAGFFDYLTVVALNRFRFRPMHLFGMIGILLLVAGLVIDLYLSACWLAGQSLSNRPLLFLGILLILVGIQSFSIGFLGELITRLHHTPPGSRAQDEIGFSD